MEDALMSLAALSNSSEASYCEDLPPTNERDSCHLDHAERGRLDGVAGIRMIGSLLGLMGAGSIILSSLIKRRVFNSEVHPIFMLSLADCLLSILWIIGAGVWFMDNTGDDHNRTVCYLVTIITGVLECVTINLCLLYALFAYLRIRKSNVTSLMMNQSYHRTSKSFVVCAYILSWLIPVVVAICLFIVSDHYLHFFRYADSCACWCRPTVINILPSAHIGYSNATDNFMNGQLKFMFILSSTISFQYIVVFIALVVIYIRILYRIRILRKEMSEQDDIIHYGTTTVLTQGHNEARKRVLLFLTAFVLTGFFNLCSELFLLALIHTILHRHHMGGYNILYFFFIYAQSFTLPLQGFINAIVYGWSRRDFMNAMSIPRSSDSIEEDYRSVTSTSDNEGARRSLTTTIDSSQTSYEASSEHVRPLLRS